MDTKTYDCKPKWLPTVLWVLFFGGWTVILKRLAETNERALDLDGIISFTQGGTSFIYGVLAFGAAGFVVIGLAGLVRLFGVPRQIILGPKSVSGPKSGLNNTRVEIPYADVTGIVRGRVRGQEFLSIRGTGAKLVIAKSMIQDHASFTELCAELDRRCI